MRLPNSSKRWRLRPAVSEDEPFLKVLFAETNVALQMLPLELRPSLAAMQYRGRQMTYASEFPDAVDSIIVLQESGSPIGRQMIARRNGRVRLIDIALLEPWQKQGIGAEVLRALLTECALEGTRIELHVFKDNPALRLYQRLGFQKIAEDAVSLEMAWAAPPP